MSKTTITSKAKLIGKVIIAEETTQPVDYATASVSAIVFPESRYPGGIGGLNYRILVLSSTVNGKPSYVYGDETLSWNATSSRWEMSSVYSGVINFSPENTTYPWEVNTWYYGQDSLAADVDAVPVFV